MTLNPLTPYEDALVAAAVKRWTGARKDHAVTGAATQEEKKDFTTDLHPPSSRYAALRRAG